MNDNYTGLGSWIMKLAGIDFDHETCGRATGTQSTDYKSSGEINLNNYNNDGSTK